MRHELDRLLGKEHCFNNIIRYLLTLTQSHRSQFYYSTTVAHLTFSLRMSYSFVCLSDTNETVYLEKNIVFDQPILLSANTDSKSS